MKTWKSVRYRSLQKSPRILKMKTVGIKVLKNTSKKTRSWSDMILEEAKQFCLNTALHGYRFIVLPRRILLERVIWVVICMASLISALTLLCMAWFNFRQNPIASVTDSTYYPIWNYEFPAVTICNNNQISRKKAFQLAKNLTVTNGRNVEQLAWDIRLLFQLINNDDSYIPAENYTRLHNLLKDNHIDVNDVLQILTQSCEEMLLRCKWKGEGKRCLSIFEQVKTNVGFCCSFNYFALKSHSFTGIFASKAPKKPRRVSACGYQTGLEVLLDNKPDDYFATHIPFIGYRIFVHNPHYFPDNNLQNMLVEIKSVNFIGVNPKLTYSTKELRGLPISVRRCLFKEESVLMDYEQYNYHNCIIECKTNLMIRLCGCISFKYVQVKDQNQAVCGPKDITCLAKYRHLIDSSVPGQNVSSINSYEEYDSTENTVCPCLPDCEITDYLSEISAGVLTRRHATNDLTLFGELYIENQTVIRVFFNDLVAIRTRWDVVFNWHTLLAYYGGLLGLFVGFSFVSGLEIIYFFFVRLLIDAVKNNKAQRSPEKMRKVRQKSKIVVRPSTFRTLNPKLLTIPSDAEIQQYKMNSYFFN